MDKRIAIVTGAANGIGRAIADRLCLEGCIVVATDIDEERGKQFVSEHAEDSADFLRCDVSDEIEVKAMFEAVKNKYGRVDVLVNNAGIIRDNVIWKMPSEDFDSVLKINLKGPWLLCREAAAMMKAQKSGRIINISSRAWLGNRGQSNYSAAKAGLIALTRVLALELGPHGVYVNAIAPGLIDTPLSQKLPPDVKEKLIAAQPTGKMGTPENVAHAVCFLANEQTHFITGQTLYVDGGKSIGAGI